MLTTFLFYFSEHEAYQVQGHMFSLYPSRTHELWGSHLSAVSSSPNVPILGGQWMPQPVLNSVPSYMSNIPSYIEHTPCPDLFTSMMESSNKPAADCHLQNPSSIVQSDKLKVMLKRKIQGSQLKPAAPAKLARISWDTDEVMRGPVYSDLNQGASQKKFHALVPSYADCQSQMMQVLQPVYVDNKASFKQSTFIDMSKKADEQVVPESYLTPDPSPVSSPEPLRASMKTDVMNCNIKATHERSSINILQALEKLAAHPHMKTEMNVAVAKEKELPILDAFDIDTFFEAVSGEFQSKTSQVMEAQMKCEIKKELPTEPMLATNIPNFAALKDEALSPLPCDSYHNVLVQPLPQTQVPTQMKPLFQSEIQPPKQSSFQPQFQSDIQLSSESQIKPTLLPSLQAQIHSQIQPSLLTQPQTQASFFPRHQSSPKTEVQTRFKLSDCYIPSSPEACMMSFPRADAPAEVPEFHSEACDYMNISRSSSAASQEAIDDLMSYLSDDSLDQMKADPKNSPSYDTQDVSSEKAYIKSFYMESSTCNKLLQTSTRLPEEFSPQSSTSTLENDFLDEGPDFSFEMNLPDNQNQMFINSIVPGMSDNLQLDFILNSFTPRKGNASLF